MVGDFRHRDTRLTVVQRDVVDHQAFHADSLQPTDHFIQVGRLAIGSDFLQRKFFTDQFIQFELVVNDSQRFQCDVTFDQSRNLDLAGRDDLQVDPSVGQRAKHAIGDARLLRHAQTNDRNLRNALIGCSDSAAQFIHDRCDRLDRVAHLFTRHCEADDGGLSVIGNVLHNHINGDFSFGDGTEQL